MIISLEEAAQAPVVVSYGERLLHIPKFTLEDMIKWGQEIVAERQKTNTAGMTDAQAREYTTFYPLLPPDRAEYIRRVQSPEGIQKLVRHGLSNALVFSQKTNAALPKLTEEEIAKIMTKGTGTLGYLANLIADLNSEVKEFKPPKPPSPDSEEKPDPLPSGGKVA